MIKAIVVVKKKRQGAPQQILLSRPRAAAQQQQIMKDLFGMVSKRSDGVCNFVEDLREPRSCTSFTPL
jgi:hypothetical protein